MLSEVLNSLSSLLGIATMVVIYAAFLLGERGSFAHKFSIAFSGHSAKCTQEVITDVNHKICAYLATKTLINVVVGVLS